MDRVEFKTAHEAHEALVPLAVELTILDGSVWTVDRTTDYSHSITLVNPTFDSISVRTTYTDKIEIGGHYLDATGEVISNDHTPYDLTSPRIGVTWARGPQAIAKEIVRRLLPEVRAYRAAMIERQRVHLAYEASLRAVAQEFACLLGDDSYIRRDQDSRYVERQVFSYAKKHGWHGWSDVSVQVADGAVNSLKIDGLTLELARNIVQLLTAPAVE